MYCYTYSDTSTVTVTVSHLLSDSVRIKGAQWKFWNKTEAVSKKKIYMILLVKEVNTEVIIANK